MSFFSLSAHIYEVTLFLYLLRPWRTGGKKTPWILQLFILTPIYHLCFHVKICERWKIQSFRGVYHLSSAVKRVKKEKTTKSRRSHPICVHVRISLWGSCGKNWNRMWLDLNQEPHIAGNTYNHYTMRLSVITLSCWKLCIINILFHHSNIFTAVICPSGTSFFFLHHSEFSQRTKGM